MDIQSYKRRLNAVIKLSRQERYDQALNVVEQLLEEFPLSSDLLVRRGCLIQLSDEADNPGRTLQAARESLETARVLAPDCVEPLIELGHFMYAVEDKPDEALEYFRTARTRAEEELQEAMTGEARCYLDQGRFSEAQAIAEQLV